MDEEGVGDAAEAGEGVGVLVGDGFVGDVAAGQDDGFGEFGEQESHAHCHFRDSLFGSSGAR
ncbi:hypothetical protein AB0J43_58215 [Nonomuraea fuscirosea]